MEKLPDIVDWDRKNFEDRKVAKMTKHLKCLRPDNHQTIKDRLDLIYKYFNLQYFENQPRKCPDIVNGNVVRKGQPTKLGGDHGFCEDKLSEDVSYDVDPVFKQKRHIEKLAFEGKVKRGIKFKDGLKLSKNVRKLGRKLRQRQFSQGCALERFQKLVTRYDIDSSEDSFRQMSELLIVHNGKIFHKDRASIPHSDQTKRAFMSAMVA